MNTFLNGFDFVGQRDGVAIRSCIGRYTANRPFDHIACYGSTAAASHKTTRYKLYRCGNAIGHFHARSRRVGLIENLNRIRQRIAELGYLGID